MEVEVDSFWYEDASLKIEMLITMGRSMVSNNEADIIISGVQFCPFVDNFQAERHNITQYVRRRTRSLTTARQA